MINEDKYAVLPSAATPNHLLVPIETVLTPTEVHSVVDDLKFNEEIKANDSETQSMMADKEFF